ncbi:MAG: ABC transporter ATP-binding protein [Candidatus Nitrosopolaris wilkensis]|nr:MAG: ABC transporter ATP-binding protein [Candidatus Nitrosopolaris wilkensis]
MIKIEELSKRLGNFQLGPLSLEVSEAQILVVLGRNGSGKTTLLNLISGILRPDQGKIFLDKILLNGMPLEKRKMGYVFQRLCLFPHLDVFSNITFGIRSPKDSESIIKTKEMVSMLGIGPLLTRNIQSLSGGEQQKVALARTLLTEPPLLLMDEPSTSMDITIKLALIQEVKVIVHRLKIPTIYVTHHASEAFNMADKIMILHNGYLVENGTRDEIMLEPKVQFTKTLIQSL